MVNGALLVTRNFPPKLGGTATQYSNLYGSASGRSRHLAGEPKAPTISTKLRPRDRSQIFRARSWLKPFEWVEAGLSRFPDARRMLKRRGFKEVHCATTFPKACRTARQTAGPAPDWSFGCSARGRRVLPRLSRRGAAAAHDAAAGPTASSPSAKTRHAFAANSAPPRQPPSRTAGRRSFLVQARSAGARRVRHQHG